MLSISEQLLLLALHDEKGSVVFNACMALPYGLGGAVLLDLYFHKKIGLEGKKIQITDNTPCGDPILDEALELIVKKEKEKNAAYWVEKIAGKVKKLQNRLAENLVQKGVLQKEKKSFLWVFKLERYPADNPLPEIELRQRLKEVVLNDGVPTEKEAVLLSLIHACELESEIFPRPDRAEAKKKIKKLIEGNEIGKAVSEVVLAITVAIMAGVIAACSAGAAAGT